VHKRTIGLIIQLLVAGKQRSA